ncbi:hypothetical protein [Nocardiopsis suaedae]|uniref:DUF402 domain-containing protein n=1 Tax=Nocardiopsis suaedae TaxID=3018444 RepID=A0ABT4TPS0_9ACTN|nr:hypothetical protein [Nocardiopsis suaedae]MDA2806684.1 hypothetical protein [Nocardiopsis suaedae]
MGYKERRAEKISTLADPHLETGEQIQTGFLTIKGSGIFTWPAEWIVVTDRAILIVGGRETQRLPRDFWFGKPTGLYHEIELDRTYKVHRQWYQEIIAADEALRGNQDPDEPAVGGPVRPCSDDLDDGAAILAILAALSSRSSPRGAGQGLCGHLAW